MTRSPRPFLSPARVSRSNLAGAAAVALAASLSAGCRGGSSSEPPIIIQRNMHRQQKYTSQAESDWFEDRRTMRPPVEGTVSQTNFEANDEVRTGRLADDSGYVLEVPDVVAARAGGMDKLVKRGEQRYGIYCTPCHATTGLGNGIVVQRGYQKPPSLHDARIRSMPDGQLYATIRNGVRNMPAYGSQVPVDDRWAIVSYLRALQLTQLAQR